MHCHFRPKGSRGTSRLLQKAIHDIHGRSRVGMASDTNKVGVTGDTNKVGVTGDTNKVGVVRDTNKAGVISDKGSEKMLPQLHSKISVESAENVTEGT